MKHGFFFIIALLLTPSLAAQSRYYVRATATGVNNGQTWTDAFTDLQAALQAAQSGDEVWVAEGLYYPTGLVDRNISFEPVSGVKLYGGFVGLETDLSQRNWLTNFTILSGDIGVSGDSTDNVYNVIYLLEPDTSTALDGFIIRDGAAIYSSPAPSRDRRRCGGGLYIMGEDADAYPDIRNCTFIHNTALGFGGGVMMNGGADGSVAPRFINCRFEKNRAMASGGGAARFGGSWVERGDDFSGCVFLKNLAGFRGGGFYFADTERNDRLDIYGCVFQENRAMDDGGGAYLSIGRLNPSGYSIRVTSFVGNIADDGAAFNSNSGFLYANYLNIDSCQFVENVHVPNNSSQPAMAKVEILGETGSKVQIKNCLFENNSEWPYIFTLTWNDANCTFDRIVMNNNKSTAELLKLGTDDESTISNSIFSCNTLGSFICNDFSRISAYNNCIFENNKATTALGHYIKFTKDTLSLGNCTFSKNDIRQMNSLGANQSIKLAFNCALLDIYNKYRFFDTQIYGEFSHCYFDTIDCSILLPNIICGPGNLIGIDPMFKDTANHDYSLLPCSPLINAGSNIAAAGILTDLAGNPRIQEGTVDIGAYEAPAFVLAAQPQVQPACVDASNGSIAVTPVFGCEPYTYNWVPDAGNGPQLNGLSPGNYLLTITDGNGRQILDTVQVASAPVPVLNPVVTDLQCGTTLGGSIAANVSGGTAPYHYQWLPAGQPDTSHLSHLPAVAAGGGGPILYALTVTDANGCQDSASASISLLGLLTLMVDGQGISCHGETDGWLSALPATGAAPFSWAWQGWPGTDSIAQPLGPGTYAVTVSDAFGCTAAFAFPPMNQPDTLWATVGHEDQTDLVTPNGAAVVTTISGGTSPFGFDWNTGSTQQAIAGLTAGSYTVTVTDKNGCEAVVEVVVDLMVNATEAVERLALLMYPNPAVDWVKVVIPTHLLVHGGQAGEWVLEICNESGWMLRSVPLPYTSDSATLDLRGWPSGNYVVRVRNGVGKGIFVGKVTKI